MKFQCVGLLVLSAMSFELGAYEQATHALLTSTAIERSALASSPGAVSELVRNLGLDVYTPFGNSLNYFEFSNDAAPSGAVKRSVQLFEREIIISLKRSVSRDPVSTWIMYGAIREDDNPSEDPPTPQDVAPGLRRPLHHFYDPVHNRRLTVPGVDALDPYIHRSPDWAIGSEDSFSNPNKPEAQRRNAFSIIDAREAMLRALTLKTYDGSQYIDVSPGTNHAKRQSDRQKYWATTLRALGDALHLNQDMGQPQHTRNEAHSGKACPGSRVCLGGHTSIYEKYMKARSLGEGTFDLKAPFHEHVTTGIVPIAFPMYPIPAFPNYTDYWSTAPGDQVAQGAGLADYSNRGFFTAGKNFGTTDYASPPSDGAAYTIRATTPISWGGVAMSGQPPVFMFYGNVPDGWLGASTTDVPLTALGYWDQFLKVRLAPAKFTLNRINYDAMANLLMPRTASYSAGIINFFFRGRLEITGPAEGVFAFADHSENKGFAKIRTTIRNTTPPAYDAANVQDEQAMLGGDLIAVLRFRKDLKYEPMLDSVVGAGTCATPEAVVNFGNPNLATQCRDASEQLVTSKPVTGVALSPGEARAIDFDFGDAPIPFGITDVALQVVYRGRLGSETNSLAVGAVDLSEPTYYTYMNATDYIWLGAHVYSRDEIAADPNLLAQIRSTCVDWTKSPPLLVSGCFMSNPIDVKLSFGSIDEPIATVKDMKVKTFMRVVYLTQADYGLGKSAVKSTRESVTVSAAPSAVESSRETMMQPKDLLNELGSCVSFGPENVRPRLAQVRMTSYTSWLAYVYPMKPMRGVNGWYSQACVKLGDLGTTPLVSDWKAEMAPIGQPGQQAMPVPAVIDPRYQ